MLDFHRSTPAVVGMLGAAAMSLSAPARAHSAHEKPSDWEFSLGVGYMGHGDLTLGWRGTRYEFSAELRNNFSTGKGAAELSMSFPLFGRFRGVVQYFNGYGDALIDYDHFQQRLGVGVLLSNLF